MTTSRLAEEEETVALTYEFWGHYKNEREASEDSMHRAAVEGITHRRFVSVDLVGGEKGGKRSQNCYKVIIRGRESVHA